jgi:hypothetical protein
MSKSLHLHHTAQQARLTDRAERLEAIRNAYYLANYPQEFFTNKTKTNGKERKH